MKKTVLFSSIAASVLAFATLSYAATEGTVTAPAAQEEATVKIDLQGALAAAQTKFAGAKALSASLHNTRHYGLVWDVRMEGADRQSIRVYVNPADGSILGANEIGIRHGMMDRMMGFGECMGEQDGMHGPRHHEGRRGEHHGMGGMGRGC